MTDEQALYCLDTNVFINPWNGYYAPDLAPGYWRGIARLVTEGRAVVSEEVRDEIRAQRDGLAEWSKVIDEWYPLTDDVQEKLSLVMSRWAHMVRRGRRNRADPVVIATARALGATVVTTEGVGSEKKPSIPYVCNELRVRCIPVSKFVREARIELR